MGATDTAQVPGYPTYFCRVRTNASPVSGQNWSFTQRIETPQVFSGYGTVTLSFWVRAPSGNIPANTFDYGLSNSTIKNAEEITDTWQKLTITRSINQGIGPGYFTVYLCYVGEGMPPFVIDIAQVQLEVGDQATEFEHEDYGTTLLKCQRYYQTYKEDSFTWSGATVTGKSFQTMVSLPVKMRDKPSATVKNSTSHEGFANGATVFAHSSESIGGSAVPTAAAGRGYYYFGFTADAEL